MNAKVFEKSFLNSKPRQLQDSVHKPEVGDTYPQPSQLVEANITLQATAFDLSAYLLKRQAEVEAALEHSIAVVYPETIYEAMRYSLCQEHS